MKQLLTGSWPTDPAMQVAIAAVAVAAVATLSLIIAFRAGRSGAGKEQLIAVLLATLAFIVLLAWGFAALVHAATHADDQSLSYAAAVAFGVYALMVVDPIARWLMRITSHRGRTSDPRASLPTGLPAVYWLLELATMVLMCAAVLTVWSMWRRPSASAVLVLVPLSVALPPVLRSAIGRRMYGERLLAAIRESRESTPADHAALQTWLNDAAPALGIGSFILAVLPLRGTFVVPLRRRAHLIVIQESFFRAMDAEERCALAAHEIAHRERDDATQRELVAGGLTAWGLVLLLWWAARTMISGPGPIIAGVLILTYGLAIVRQRLSHRSEFAADRRAAEIVGDRGVVIRLLTHIAQLQRRSLTRGSPTHPSFARRIAALKG